MNVRFFWRFFASIFICITFYSFIGTSWGDRIKVLFSQYGEPSSKLIPNELVYEKKYILQRMEQTIASGTFLQQQIAALQKKEKAKKESKKTSEPTTDQSTIALLHQYRLWQLQAKAMIAELDKKLLTRFQGKNAAVTAEALTTIVAHAKKQLPEKSEALDEKRIKELEKKVIYDIEKQFALFFTHSLKDALEEKRSKLTFKDSQKILLELGSWFTQDNQLLSSLPIIQENNISFFDALQMLVPEQEYNALTRSVTSLVEKVSTIVKECSQFPTCLPTISFINKQMIAIEMATISTFEITGKNYTTISKALTLYRTNCATVVIQALKHGATLQEGIDSYYELIIPLTSVLTAEQKKEHASSIRSVFSRWLHRYVTMCEQKPLLANFPNTIRIFSTSESIAMITADGLPAKELVPMRVLFLTLHARLNQCGGTDKITLKNALQQLQTRLYTAQKNQQQEVIKKELDTMLVTQVTTVSDKTIKAFEPNSKEFIALFLPDSYDVQDFLQIAGQKPTFIKQIDALMQNKTDQATAKKKLFLQQVQEFSNYVKEKYQFLQQLFNTLEQIISVDQKDKSLLLIKELIVREPMLYERLRKSIRSVVLSKDEKKKTTLVNEVKELFVSLLPILTQLAK